VPDPRTPGLVERGHHAGAARCREGLVACPQGDFENAASGADAHAGERRWWLVVEGGRAGLCRADPGPEPTLVVEPTALALTEIWTGGRVALEVVDRLATRVRGRARDRTICADGSGAARLPTRGRHPGRPDEDGGCRTQGSGPRVLFQGLANRPHRSNGGANAGGC
jgi:hypothetical protein